MRLIGLAVVLAVSLTLAPVAAEAQAEKVARIAVLSTLSAASGQGFAEAFTQGLRECYRCRCSLTGRGPPPGPRFTFGPFASFRPPRSCRRPLPVCTGGIATRRGAITGAPPDECRGESPD